MAAAVTPEGPFMLGPMRIFLSAAGAPPSAAGDGVYELGDWIINRAPAAGGAGISHWICTTAGVGGTAVFTSVTLS